MYTDHSMRLTDNQQNIIDKAIELLKPFDKENYSFSLHYFKEKNINGNEIGEEVCDNEKCVKAYLKELRLQLGKYKRIYVQYDHYNNGDHERISRCAICDRPLNEQLTWISQEFSHHKEYTITLEDLTQSRNAFDVRCMLEAMPTVDCRISEYAKHKGGKTLEEDLKRQSDFVTSVVKYAELICDVINHHQKTNSYE